MTIAAATSNTPKLRVARQLAQVLLEGQGTAGEVEVVAAFRSYLRLLRLKDDLAIAASSELADWHLAPRPEPYFLELLQRIAEPTERKASGIFYTPWPVAQWIVQCVARHVPEGPLRIVDPACGSGIFLLAAANLVQRRPGSTLVGYDTSAAATMVATELLCGLGVPSTVRRTNPLLAGEELRSALLAGGETLVIVGNPPYSNFGRRNRGAWIDGLLASYRHGIAERKVNLTDDFIKFLRWGQHWIDQAGRGLLAMITSRTYLAGITHREMRRSLARSFSSVEIVDLHGDGDPGDANIFGVRRGIAISVFRKGDADELGRIRYCGIGGTRIRKLAWLKQSNSGGSLHIARPPDWRFVPDQRRTKPAANDYLSWPRLDEIFAEFISGVQTKNDRLFVDHDREVLAERMKRHLDQAGKFFDPSCLRAYIVGPFDRRWIYYDPRLLGRARWSVMRHMVQARPNLALVFMRQSSSAANYDHVLVVDSLASDRVFYSRRGAPFMAPLWRITGVPETLSSNLHSAWMDAMVNRIGEVAESRSLLAYIYATLHSSAYRRNHLAELQCDFPRIPWPDSTTVFHRLSAIGEQLIACHVADDQHRYGPLEFVGKRNPLIARGYPQVCDKVLKLNAECGLLLTGWQAAHFQVGGHAVLLRWLKVRRGRRLSPTELRYLAWLEHLAVTTCRLTAEIDAVYESKC